MIRRDAWIAAIARHARLALGAEVVTPACDRVTALSI